MKSSAAAEYSSASPSAASHTAAEHLAELRHQIEHAAHLLPAQGPITVFVHHNTLHALEDMPFSTAMAEGMRIFGCQTFWPEERYRQMLTTERIRMSDLAAVLLEDLGETDDFLIGRLGTRFHLRMAMLEHPLVVAPTAELRWLVAETDALEKYRPETPPLIRSRSIEETRRWVMRDLRQGQELPVGGGDRRIQEALANLLSRFGANQIETWSDATWESFCLHWLWRVCHHGVHGVRRFAPAPANPVRHRDLLVAAGGEDPDALVHDTLIRWCAAFLDQGVASWPWPARQQGFYRAVVELYRGAGGPPDRWLAGLPGELSRLHQEGLGPLESIQESFELLGVAPHEQEAFLSATLLALRGWAGMFWQLETRGDRVALPALPGSLLEFLAVRLILDRLAAQYVARTSLDLDLPLVELRRRLRVLQPKPEAVRVDQRAYLVFQLAQVLGWKPADLYLLSKQEWSLLVEEIEAFSSHQRRRVYQLAYERRYRTQALDALIVQSRRQPPAEVPADRPPPRFQVVCCIDDREESFRRHLEELDPECETWAAAGFFAVPMYYRGAADAHFVPLCPIVMRPQHWVVEEVSYAFADSHRRRTWRRRLLGQATHHVHVGSRSFTLGAVLTALVGPLASIPLVARVLFPRLTSQLRQLAANLVDTPPVTELHLERVDGSPSAAEEGLGFTVEEMANQVERLLRDIGMTRYFSRLVLIVGHGSSSINNPHESAYNCGACAGSRGGPNARALARMANDPRVRQILSDRGLHLTPEVVFVGSLHNTCNDQVSYFDLDRLPLSHHADFEHLRRTIDLARLRNAHERCRRFESAPLTLSAEAALKHVEARAEDLAQTRPEYNHATNAMCVVGRRQRTRGLYMDRRSFLTSYDPTQDDADATILSRVLGAVMPVCAGISLEYYFSTVDPVGLGCSTKLPHNVTSLVGVMDGAASDLRTGLSSQMTEIHEPLRIVFVVETRPETMLSILQRQPSLDRLVRNQWVQLATLSPTSAEIHLYRNGAFEPYQPEAGDLPRVPHSLDWYRGWRDHLGFARIVPDGPAAGDAARSTAAKEST